MNAYAEMYMPTAQENLGCMLDFAVHHLHFELSDFYDLFLQSKLSGLVAMGDANAIAGRSGVESALLVLKECDACVSDADLERALGEDLSMLSRSPEYWTGWLLAYYQWSRNLSFSYINEIVPIADVCGLYRPFHEASDERASAEIDRAVAKANPTTRLAFYRQKAGLSQGNLAALSGVSVRTIQHYEQRSKDINHARFDQILALSRALHVESEKLREPLDAARYEYAVVPVERALRECCANAQ